MCVEYAFTSVYVCVCTIMKARGVPCSIAFCLSPLRQDLSPELGWQPETPVLLLSLPPKCGDAGIAGPDRHVQLFCGNTGSPSYAHLLGKGTA